MTGTCLLQGGWTALHWGADGLNRDIVQLLLSKQAEVNVVNNVSESTPVILIALRKQKDGF